MKNKFLKNMLLFGFTINLMHFKNQLNYAINAKKKQLWIINEKAQSQKQAR